MGINFRMLSEIEAARDAAAEVAEQTGDEQTKKLAIAVDKLARQMLWLMPDPTAEERK